MWFQCFQQGGTHGHFGLQCCSIAFSSGWPQLIFQIPGHVSLLSGSPVHNHLSSYREFAPISHPFIKIVYSLLDIFLFHCLISSRNGRALCFAYCSILNAYPSIWNTDKQLALSKYLLYHKAIQRDHEHSPLLLTHSATTGEWHKVIEKWLDSALYNTQALLLSRITTLPVRTLAMTFVGSKSAEIKIYLSQKVEGHWRSWTVTFKIRDLQSVLALPWDFRWCLTDVFDLSSNYKNIMFKLFFLKDRITEREREISSVHKFIPQMPTKKRARPSRGQGPGTLFRTPTRMACSAIFSQALLFLLLLFLGIFSF